MLIILDISLELEKIHMIDNIDTNGKDAKRAAKVLLDFDNSEIETINTRVRNILIIKKNVIN